MNKIDRQNIFDLQSCVVNSRKKYGNVILKYEQQNHNIELKILENTEIRSNEMKDKMPLDFCLTEDIANDLTYKRGKTKINAVQNQLKNLDKFITMVINRKNCDIYKHLERHSFDL